MKKSLRKNAVLSAGQKLLSIVFPLITFPYISRVLRVEDIGKINFANSIVSYFVLLSSLGILNYATREGARIRDNKEKFNQFCKEIFTINILSTCVAYVALVVACLVSSKIRSYEILILIQSFSIIGGTIGINWIYTIEEDYLYITIRTLIVQVISVVLMLTMVKIESDYLIYVALSTFATVGANIFNFFHARKYVKIGLTTRLNLKKHLKPILIIFASTIAVTIYVDSDTTLLGFLNSEYCVGLYGRSSKIYTLIKQMVAAMVVVALPNLSNISESIQIEEYINKARKILYDVLFLAIPVAIGLCLTSEDVLLILAGQKYIEATRSLQILAISSFFAVMSSFVTYCCLLPLRFEKLQLIATVTSAVVNVSLNFLILPSLAHTGAAITTLFSEALVFVIEVVYFCRKSLYKPIFKLEMKNIASLVIGGLWIVAVCMAIEKTNLSFLPCFVIKVVVSAIGYGVVLLTFKYPSVKMLLKRKRQL